MDQESLATLVFLQIQLRQLLQVYPRDLAIRDFQVNLVIRDYQLIQALLWNLDFLVFLDFQQRQQALVHQRFQVSLHYRVCQMAQSAQVAPIVLEIRRVQDYLAVQGYR